MNKFKPERSQIMLFILFSGILLSAVLNGIINNGWFYRHKTYTVDTGTVKEKSFLIGLDYTDTWAFDKDWLIIEISHEAPLDVTITVQSTKDGREIARQHPVTLQPYRRKVFSYQIPIDAEIKEVKVTCTSNSKENDAIVVIWTTDNYFD